MGQLLTQFFDADTTDTEVTGMFKGTKAIMLVILSASSHFQFPPDFAAPPSDSIYINRIHSILMDRPIHR